ncbi:ATP-binding protein [Cohnella fermenti]|uniref:histidine kinase n=1 Tax=Cohnella fermenti TaxID=2565925 RepID=A0A4S4C8R2_9BACL|nr:ATP-binding protein [Cohnella fermenti]THF82151.1 response regulator [Cohnella fermenti]
MRTKRIFLIIGIYLLIITGIRLVWITLESAPSYPDAAQGTMDLASWDYSSDRAIPLNGEWEFYPHSFYRSDYGQSSAASQPEPIKVPDNWGQTLDPARHSPIGYGSYRLLIHVPSGEKPLLGIRVPPIPTASELYVDGKLLAHSGTPGKDAGSFTARKVPYYANFYPEGDTIEVVIQVANYDDYSRGGLISPVLIGTQQAIEKKVWLSRGMEVMVCVILLLHAVYACQFLFIGGRAPGLMNFVLLIVSVIVSILIDDERLLTTLLPINYEWYVRLFHLSYLGTNYFLVRNAMLLTAKRTAYGRYRWFNGICLLYAGIALLLPLQPLLKMGYFSIPLFLFTVAAVPTLAFRSAKQGNRNAMYLLIGGITISINTLWGLVSTFYFPQIGYYPLDLIFAVLAIAAYWIKHHVNSTTALRFLTEKLQKADKQKDEFLAHTSHELRNPLHGMLNIAQAVLDDESGRRESRHADSLQLLIAVGRRMSYMLNDLLDINRLRGNSVHIQSAPVRVQAVASGVIDMLRFMADGKPIRIVNAIPDGFPPVQADENRLTQILFNLLHNAVKFTMRGHIEVRAAVRNGYACITVSDTGIGMDKETMQRIFLPYEQADSSADSLGGIGLGLSICKQLIELQGGTISAESALDRGSTFSFTLPVAASLPEHSAETAAAATEVAAAMTEWPTVSESPAHAIDRIRILAVDDDPVNLRVLTHALASEPYTIGTAIHGNDAIAMLDKIKWDMMIIDVMMPGMSGYELTRRVRQRFSIAELPVLLLTARSQPEDIRSGFLAGANDYIIKPMNTLELKSRIRALTDLTLAVRDRVHMEAAWLQAQIKPHFLFNTLNSIVALGEIDTERMHQLADAFSIYLHASFDFKNSDKLVPLSDELELVEAYLSIEKERFEERLQVQWDVEASFEMLVPPLSIQPLVENAVRHGIMQRACGGTIRIRIAEYEDRAEVAIEDDGVGMDEAAIRHLFAPGSAKRRRGIGLLNTNRRLEQLYGHGLRIESKLNEGTTVSFQVLKPR